MTTRIERSWSKRPVTWVTLIGLLALPALIGGILVAALHQPTERLENMMAAIVNDDEGVEIDAMRAHGGVFRTAGVAQQLLAEALGVPVAVADTASEGGAWGIAVLAAYRRAVHDGETRALPEWLDEPVFADAAVVTVTPTASEIEGYASYLARWEAGLAVQHAAIAALRDGDRA